MAKSSAPIRAGVLLAGLALATPLFAQGMGPVPPVPGPYSLMPIPVPLAGNAPAAQTAPVYPGNFGAMRVPYWMQQQQQRAPGVAGTAPEAAPESGAPTAPVDYAPVAPSPGPAYGQATAPGFFPGFQAGPGAVSAGGGARADASGVIATAPGARGYQPYPPQAYGWQPYSVAPGWGPPQPGGWGGAPGWGQPQPWGGAQ